MMTFYLYELLDYIRTRTFTRATARVINNGEANILQYDPLH